MPPEETQESPYIGGAGQFDDLDVLSPEEQALYDEEMNEGVDTPPEVDLPLDEDAPEVITDEDADEVEQENAPAPAEPEPEPEADPEVEEEEEPAPAPATSGGIPKARLDRELQRNRELQQQIAELTAKKRVEEVSADDADIEVEFDAEAITRALDMNLDGKNSEAAAILIEQLSAAVKGGVRQGRAQMRGEIEASREAAVTTAVGQVGAQSVQSAYDAAVDQVETDYPVFNPDSEAFDAELAGRAATMINALRADGLSAAEALVEAVDLTITRHRPDLLKQPAAPAPAAAPAVNQPTTASRARNAAAAAAQPSRNGGVPNSQEDAGRVDLDTLTEEEFDALPASRLAELRGDFL